MEIPSTPFGWAMLAAVTLLGVLWGIVRGQNGEQGKRISTLETQNVEQQKDLTRLITQMKNREDVHEEHRDTTAAAIASLKSDMRSDFARLNDKIDRWMGMPRNYSPSPGRYGGGSGTPDKP